MLTIGITTLGNTISDHIIEFLSGMPVKVIISECRDDLSKNEPPYVKKLRDSGVDTTYLYFGKPGIANNRQNILDHVTTKYFYTIDNDDALTGNLADVVEYLKKHESDAFYIRCYEDGNYMHIPGSLIYMCTWMQIFRTEWFRSLGGYVQSWNFIHEECTTNLNLRANLNGKNYKRVILPKRYLTYQYHANSACNIAFDVSKVCDFIKGIPSNEKILHKKKFLILFKNFGKKYFRIYRVTNSGDVVFINNFINGTFEDIIDCINRTFLELKK